MPVLITPILKPHKKDQYLKHPSFETIQTNAIKEQPT